MKKQTKTHFLSIIIISYNTKDIILNCLQSIFNSKFGKKYNYEIVIVDNNSNDDSVKEIKKMQIKHKNIVLIENKENSGFGKANNQAVQEAKGDYILLLNSDIETLDNSIGKLFDYFLKNEKKINFLGGKLLNKDLSDQASCGPFFSLPVVFAFLFLKGDSWGLTRESPSKIKQTDWLSGACILTKKTDFNALKGFDTDIFMYMEEVELLYRAKKKGKTVFFYPDARFIHFGSASSNKSYPIIQVYNGLLYFYKKHKNPLSLIILKFMLQLKALISIFIGKLVKNKYLVNTYGKAYEMAKLG
jgi:hypothetical protein